MNKKAMIFFNLLDGTNGRERVLAISSLPRGMMPAAICGI